MYVFLLIVWLVGFPFAVRYAEFFDISKLSIEYTEDVRAKNRKVSVVIYYTVAGIILLLELINFILRALKC